MITSLHIQNVALVDDVEIEFGKGLNVLTGETGAGKSIIIGSFNFIMGARLQKSIIKQGATSARVDAVFSIDEDEKKRITEICGAEVSDNNVILSRVLKASGQGDCRVNGVVVTTEVLAKVASVLADMHGQHDTEVLLKPKNHVTILDSFGGQKIVRARLAYEGAVCELGELKKQLKVYGGDDFERKRLVDMYKFQINEIEQVNPKKGEDEDLLERKNVMQNFERLKMGLAQTVAYFEGDDGIASQIKQAVSSLGGISNLDKCIEKFLTTVQSLKAEIDDVGSDISGYCENMEFDEEEYKRVTERLDDIKVLKRKYGNSVDDILKHLADVSSKLEMLERSEEDIERINKQIAQKQTEVESLGGELVAVRTAVAREMAGKIVGHLHDLGMPSAKFLVDEITVEGVNFLFSANAGVSLKPLSHIISGGEMSRFMLAIKAVTVNMNSVGCMV
ncbi:MAG: AAA family ATPase, partial [Firmicutes bacterium]|nr:AAA family ATPase [Bacillota bacterium]